MNKFIYESNFNELFLLKFLRLALKNVGGEQCRLI